MIKTKLREVKTKFSHLQTFREATVDRGARTARVVIITEGIGNLRDRNYYDKNAVRSCAKVFNGRQAFIDHPSDSEEHDRPERSVRDLAGYFYDTEIGTVRDPDTGEQLTACFAKLKFDESESGQFALDKVASAIEYQERFPDSKDVYAGISINGGGLSHPGTIKGMQVNLVTEIQEAFSADLVTKPARGGKFLALMQEAEKTRLWKQKTARESRTLTWMGSERGRGMKTPVMIKKESDKPKDDQKKLRETVRAKLRASKEAISAKKPKLAIRLAKEALKEAKTMRTNEDEVKALMRKMRAAINDGGDPLTIVKDIGADISQLEKSLAPPEKGEAETETMNKASEDEGAEQESEDEGESEDQASENEDEEESETSSSEDEEEGEAGYMADEEEGEDENDMGMSDDDDEMPVGDQEEDDEKAMQYKCATCGEVNQVMAPKGYKLARMGESEKKGQESVSDKALRETVSRLRIQMKEKETRFTESNKKTRKLIEENVRLRAEVLGHRRMREAKKLLKEAQIPPDVLSVSDLVSITDKTLWPVEIKRAKRMLAREAQLYDGGAGPHSNGSGGKVKDEGDDAVATFKRFYESSKDDEGKDD